MGQLASLISKFYLSVAARTIVQAELTASFGLAVKAFASRAEEPGFESRFFSGVESYQ